MSAPATIRLTAADYWYELDVAVHRLLLALTPGRDDVVTGAPWAPDRAQLKHLVLCVYGASAPEEMLDEACYRYREFMR